MAKIAIVKFSTVAKHNTWSASFFTGGNLDKEQIAIDKKRKELDTQQRVIEEKRKMLDKQQKQLKRDRAAYRKMCKREGIKTRTVGQEG